MILLPQIMNLVQMIKVAKVAQITKMIVKVDLTMKINLQKKNLMKKAINRVKVIVKKAKKIM